MMELPVYKLVIDEKDESGVDYIALVDQPAILRNWRAFDSQVFIDYPDVARDYGNAVKRLQELEERDTTISNKFCIGEGLTLKEVYEVSNTEEYGKEAQEWASKTFNRDRYKFNLDEDRQILSGFAMIADLPIYRYDERGEYYVMFDKDTIEQIVHKYFSNSFHKNFNRMHNMGEALEDVFLFESMVIDSERGIKTPEGYEEAPDGSWFISVKVTNPEEWQKVKENFNGFSVEGLFGEIPVGIEKEENLEEQIKQLTGTFQELLNLI